MGRIHFLCGVINSMPPRNNSKCSRKVISIRFFKNIDTRALRRLIETAPWWILDTKPNINDKFNLFLKICVCILDMFAPIKKKRVKIHKPFWMSADYQAINYKVEKAKKEALNTNLPEKWNEFKFIRNKAFHLKTKLKTRSIKQLIEKNSKSIESKLH